MLRNPCRQGLVSAVLLAVAQSASAVIIAGGDGSGNTNLTGVSGGAYVGTVNGASGVFLGYGGWVLTAAHVGSGDFTLGATTYTASGPSYRLHEAGNPAANTDLVLFHLATWPSLADLTLASSDPTTNTAITMIGAGRNRATSISYYQVNTLTTPYTWAAGTLGNHNASGFAYAAGTTLRWGTNNVSGPTETINPTDGVNFYGNTVIFPATFDAAGGSNEAIVAPGDSGGGVFLAGNILVGINDSLAVISGQPADTAIFNDASYMTNIASYRDQIVALVPEPSAIALLGGLGVSLLMRRRRQAHSFV